MLLPLPAAAAARVPALHVLQVRIVEHAFDIIHLLTDQNPIQIVVDAIINRCGSCGCSSCGCSSCGRGASTCSSSTVACSLVLRRVEF